MTSLQSMDLQFFLRQYYANNFQNGADMKNCQTLLFFLIRLKFTLREECAHF
jgi:hypothetical protein